MEYYSFICITIVIFVLFFTTAHKGANFLFWFVIDIYVYPIKIFNWFTIKYKYYKKNKNKTKNKKKEKKERKEKIQNILIFKKNVHIDISNTV